MTEPQTIQNLMRDLAAIPGIGSVHIADSWADGYRAIRLTIAFTHRTTTAFKTRASGVVETWFQIPECRRIVSAVRAAVKKSELICEGFSTPKRVVEYLDRVSKGRGEKPQSGYDDFELRVEVYA